jgi:hypothetical protein
VQVSEVFKGVKMKKNYKTVLFAVLLISLSAIAAALIVSNEEPGQVIQDDADTAVLEGEEEEDYKIGEVSLIKGETGIIRADKEIVTELGESYILRDIAETGENSKLNISLVNESMLLIGGEPETFLVAEDFLLADEEREGKAEFFLSYGKVRAVTCEDNFNILTPMSSVYGTGKMDFIVWEDITAEMRRFCVAVLEDKVYLKNIDESVKGVEEVSQGEMSCVSGGEPPTEPETIPKELMDKLLEEEDQQYNTKQVCKPKCDECEDYDPITDECVFVKFKPCDDEDPCTVDDRCISKNKCKGKKDPSPTDPECLEGGVEDVVLAPFEGQLDDSVDVLTPTEREVNPSE